MTPLAIIMADMQLRDVCCVTGSVHRVQHELFVPDNEGGRSSTPPMGVSSSRNLAYRFPRCILGGTRREPGFVQARAAKSIFDLHSSIAASLCLNDLESEA